MDRNVLITKKFYRERIMFVSKDKNMKNRVVNPG